MTSIERLIAEFTDDVAALMLALQNGQVTPLVWESLFAQMIAQYSQAAMMLGLDTAELIEAEIAYLVTFVEEQLAYLSNFELVIESMAEFVPGWNNRASMYAQAIKNPYWKGAVDMLPLPAMPAQGTECLTLCKCSWRIEVIDSEAGDYDAYWERGVTDSCPTCIERESMWNPILIRDGMLQ